MHKSLDKLLDSLFEKTDLFVEAYIGLNGRFPNKKVKTTIVVTHPTQAKVGKYLREVRKKVTKIRSALKEPEYINILDEILAALDRALYLLTLN